MYIKFTKHIIEAVDGPLKVSTVSMIALGMYEFKYLNKREITPKKYITNAYVEELYEA